MAPGKVGPFHISWPRLSIQIVLEPQGCSSTSASYTWPLHLIWSLLGSLHFRPASHTRSPVQGGTAMGNFSFPLLAHSCIQPIPICVVQKWDLSLKDKGSQAVRWSKTCYYSFSYQWAVVSNINYIMGTLTKDHRIGIVGQWFIPVLIYLLMHGSMSNSLSIFLN